MGRSGPREGGPKAFSAPSFPPLFPPGPAQDHRTELFGRSSPGSWWQLGPVGGGSVATSFTAHRSPAVRAVIFPTPLPSWSLWGGAATTPAHGDAPGSSPHPSTHPLGWAFPGKPRKRWPLPSWPRRPWSGGRTTCREQPGAGPGFWARSAIHQAMDTARRCHPSYYGQRR